jgi:hypothetical protein
VEFADGWSGSVGQSRSRVLVRRLGLAPDRQVRLRPPGGTALARRAFARR